jgi:hypothetical protein
MKSVFFQRLKTLLHSSLPMALLSAAFAVSLSGCPGGADLEHPEKYFAGSPGTGAGGSGTGGTGAGGKALVEIPIPVVAECTTAGGAEVVLARTCALSGCHKPGAIKPQAGLILTGDTLLVSRLKDVPSTHADIYCGSMPCPTIPEECPKGDMLVDSADYTKSWMLIKMNDAMLCGDLMPPSITFTPEDKACLDNLVKAIAELP